MTTAAEARRNLAGKTIWLWHYMHADWQWEASRAWHADRYALAVQEALDLMQQDDEFCYYFDTESEFFEPVARRLGPRLEELRQRVREGRVRIVSAQVANCRPTQTGDETYLRNLQLGRTFFEASLPPTDIRQFHSVDIAIGGCQMPQVLALAGFKYYRAWRPHGALNAHRVPHQFWWQAPDGSRVLVTRGIYGGLYLPNPPFDAYREDWDGAVAAFYDEFFKDQLLDDRSPSGQLWVTQGMDDARPLRRHIGDAPVDLPGFIAEWRQRESVPIHWCTPQDYSEAVEAHGENLRTLTGALDGCDCAYNAAMGGANGLWRWRQMNDRRLLRAEWWNAAAAVALGAPPARQELTRLWRQHLTYQAHAQEAAFEDDRAQLVDLARDVRFHAERIEQEALISLAQAAGGGTRTTRYLFNPHPWPLQAEVEVYHPCAAAGVMALAPMDEAGATLPCQVLREYRHPRFAGSLTDQTLLVQADLPPLGFRRIELVESSEPAPAAPDAAEPGETLAAAGLRLTYRNHALREVRDANGFIYQARDGSAWPGLVFHVLDHQDWFSVGPELRREVYQAESSAWLQYGPLRWQHRSCGRLGPWEAQVDTALGTRQRELMVHIRLEGHWHEPPATGFVTLLADIPAGGELTVDTPFAVEPRDPDHEYYYNSLPPEVEVGDLGMGMFERQRPGFFWGRSWADWSSTGRGLTWLSVDGNYYWFKEPGCLGPIVTRALARHPDDWERFMAAALSGAGVHEFTWVMRLHDGDWRAADPQRRSQELRHPPEVVHPNCPVPAKLDAEFSLLTLSDNALLSACYAEGNDLVVRFYEREGRAGEVELTTGFTPAAVSAEDLLGRPLDVPLRAEGRSIRATVRPRQIVTLRIAR